MTAAAGRFAGSARAAGTVTLVFAAASVIMSAMTLTAVAVGLDGSGTLVDFTVCLGACALLALTVTAGLAVGSAHAGSQCPQRPRVTARRLALSHPSHPDAGRRDVSDH